MTLQVHQTRHAATSGDRQRRASDAGAQPVSRELFAHPVDDFQVIETHISCLLLTGPYVYKFKKPVDLGFLDFSSPRRAASTARRNCASTGQLAPELYQGLVRVTGDIEHPELDGDGPLLEYAVKMRQFPEDNAWIMWPNGVN
jgi:uncharacterized protein